MTSAVKSNNTNIINQINYDNTTYQAGPGVDLDDLKFSEDWEGRPASEWSVKRIGILESKIESYTYQIFRSNRYGKHNLSKVIPGFKLIQFANEAFGSDGWYMDVLNMEVVESHSSVTNLPEIPKDENEANGESAESKEMHNVIAEAQVKVTLKDGTNTQMGGIGRATLPSKGHSFAKAKKEAISDALKKCILSFETIIMEYNTKVQNNYYVDGLYVSKVKQEGNDLGVSLSNMHN